MYQLPQLPEPILFHLLKHHLSFIRYFIKTAGQAEIAGIQSSLRTLGTSQLDLYTGQLSPFQIAQEVISYLQYNNLMTPDAYKSFISREGSDFRIIQLSDKTDWVLRWGFQENRYVHLHPGRNTCNTVRVKATTLKTAIAALVISAGTQKELGLMLINKVRMEWLRLSPVNDLGKASHLLSTISLLNGAN